MDLVVEMWKNNSPLKQAGFPTIPTTEKNWVIDNWKNGWHKAGAGFPTYQQPDDGKFLFMN